MRKKLLLLEVAFVLLLSIVAFAGANCDIRNSEYEQELLFEFRYGTGEAASYRDFAVAGLYVVSGRPNYRGEIVIPNYVNGVSVVGIAFQAFGSITPSSVNLRKLTIPRNIRIIANAAFENIRFLEKVIFEEGSKLRAIGNRAFSYAGFRDIDLPSSIEFIGRDAFTLEKFVAPKSMLHITESPFHIGYLTNVVLHDKVESISTRAFAGARSINSIFIPKSVLIVGTNAFANWTKEQTIYIEHEFIPSGWSYQTLHGYYFWNHGGNATIVWGATREMANV